MSLPERLGRLRRVRRLGSGGFATVWLYRDDELRSDVAVKALADNWAQRWDVRQRFLEEARILRAADSDHLVRVHDIGDTDGTPWFVMTYADLGSLDAGLTGTPWSPAHVVPIVTQAATGLAVLHEQGVVHRDVKPQNLLLRGDGRNADGAGPDEPGRDPAEPVPVPVLAGARLMVADLGVAKAMLHASGLTQVVGTPAYMAPEQATGEGLDTRADVHALGAVAYHLLTGRVLREGGLADLVEGPPPVPPSALVDVPAAVDQVLLRAVRYRPEDRWDDVGAFAAALAVAVRHGTPPPPEDRTRQRIVAASAPVPAPAATGTVDSSPARTGTTDSDTGDGGQAVRRGLTPVLAVLLVVLVLGGSFAVAFGITQLVR